MKKHTVDGIVRELIIESGGSTEHKYATYLQYAISGLRELNLDTSGVPKTAILTVNANNTVDLPDDFISHVRIAVCGADGNLHYLGLNDDICLPPGFDDCGDLTSPAGSGAAENSTYWGSNEGGHYKNGENIGRHFGVGGGTNQNGYYRIYEKEGYIALQSSSATELYVEYLADLERNSNGELEIHPFIVEALKSWMFYKSVQRNLRVPANRVMIAEDAWNKARNIANKRMKSFTLDEAKLTIRRSFSPAPKT